MQFQKESSSDWKNTAVSADNNKWTVDIKPCMKYHFKIVVISHSDSSKDELELSKTVGPATDDQLRESRYLPEVPTDFGLESVNHSAANIKWKGADCTSEYFVTYKIQNADGKLQTWNGAETQTTVTGLKNCTEYDVTIAAYGPSDKEPDNKLEGSFKTTGCSGTTSASSLVSIPQILFLMIPAILSLT